MKELLKCLNITLICSVFAVTACKLNAQTKLKTTQENTDGFFTLGKVDDHMFFITPEGKPFFSLGINHIDPASLRYPENIHIWKEKYDGSTTKWLKSR